MGIETITSTSVKDLVPYPANDANKYTRGKLTLVGGSKEYPGAACMASMAALRSGVGYMEVACEKESLPIVQGHDPNIVARAWDGFSCQASQLDAIKENHPKACLVGSGFSKPNAPQDALLQEVLLKSQYPVLVDGGAIESLATATGLEAARKRQKDGFALVLTPHYGEAMRLAAPIGAKPPAVEFKNPEDDAAFASKLSEAYGAIVVLKGPMTLIVDFASSECFLMDEGPACLAKAGTGDVLAGMTAAFLAQGMNPIDACKLSTLTHALSATFAERDLTSVCVCATDVIDHIPDAVGSYR